MSSQKIPGKHVGKNFKLGPTIYNHSFFKIVYMFFESKIAFFCKKYIRNGIYGNRIYEITFSKLKNKR